MPGDQDILRTINEAFSAERRPAHFTDYTHCCECAEHDALLRARERETLALEDVGNAGWDPICFVTSDGFRYYLPALVRLALSPPEDRNAGPYLSQLLFHLIGDGENNRRVSCCAPAQRRAVVEFLWHVVSARDCAAEGCKDDLQRAIDIWSADAALCASTKLAERSGEAAP